MKIWMTGENGFVSRAFVRHLSHKHIVENSHLNDMYDYWRQKKFSFDHHSEIDIFDPTLENLLERSGVECIIHTATLIVPEDDKSHWMVRNNIEGSYYIAQHAKKLDIPIVFIKYNNHPNNMFNYTQDAISLMFKNMGIDVIEIITDELFGPEDFHGSISQLLMTSVGRSDMAVIYANLGDKRKYTFIDDFLDGVDMILSDIEKYKNKSIQIMDDNARSLEDAIDYMANSMELNLVYDIKECESSIIKEDVKELNLDKWSCKYPFAAALEITRDLINDRTR